MKIYVVSIMAFSGLIDCATTERNTLVEHLPAMIPAKSIEEAAEDAKNFALDRWKQSEGWSGHQAAVMAVTKSFYDAAFEAKLAGIIDSDDENEEGQAFQFTPNLQDVNSDCSVN